MKKYNREDYNLVEREQPNEDSLCEGCDLLNSYGLCDAGLDINFLDCISEKSANGKVYKRKQQ